MLGVTLYELGDVEAAESLLLPALAAMEQGETWYELLARSYATAAAIARRRSGTPAALEVIRRARETAAARDIGRLEDVADILELIERAAAGEVETTEVMELEAATRARLAVTQSPRVRFRRELALARLELQRHQPSAALALLTPLVEASRAASHWRVHIEALALRALALHALGEHWQARQEFDA